MKFSVLCAFICCCLIINNYETVKKFPQFTKPRRFHSKIFIFFTDCSADLREFFASKRRLKCAQNEAQCCSRLICLCETCSSMFLCNLLLIRFSCSIGFGVQFNVNETILVFLKKQELTFKWNYSRNSQGSLKLQPMCDNCCQPFQVLSFTTFQLLTFLKNIWNRRFSFLANFQNFQPPLNRHRSEYSWKFTKIPTT